MPPLKILLIEDNPGDALLIREMLAESHQVEFTVDWKQTLAGGLDVLGTSAASPYDAVLLDLGLPDSPQPSVSFTRVQSVAPGTPIIILTGHDDETFAVTTVRRGAQDYLIKGTIDTGTLVRTVRYAIARKMGGEKTFTPDELARFDGKDGRPAYFAYMGKVYDASGSRLWRGGRHGAAHQAGADLTEPFSRAPHREEVLSRLPILGTLVPKEALGLQLLRRIDRLHLHATFVHLTIAYTIAAPFFFLAWILSGRKVLDEITLYLLALGLITVPLSFITGAVSWVVNYETKAAFNFNLKFVLGILLLLCLLGSFFVRVTGSETVLAKPSCWFFLGLLTLQLVLALMLDFFGKKIVYS